MKLLNVGKKGAVDKRGLGSRLHLALAVATIRGVLLDPVDEFANSGIDTWSICLSAAKTEGYNASELVASLVDNQGATTVTLAGILATRLDQASAEHYIGDLVLVACGAALCVGDDGHINLLQVVAGCAALLDQTPAGNGGLAEQKKKKEDKS